ncbi:MAG: hypothetical protein ABL961_15500 [Vicinamibacterales bacterium]
MRLGAFALVVWIGAASAAAQDRALPAADPTLVDGRSQAQLPDPATLARIREALTRSSGPILAGLDRRADFRVEIQEKQRLESLLKRLDVRAGPTPAGGLYMYEQNRMLFNPVDRPLMQPYAAFSGSELITLAIQNILGRYLAKPLIKSAMNARRSAQESAATEEARRSIAAYCQARPDFMDIRLCNPDAR